MNNIILSTTSLMIMSINIEAANNITLTAEAPQTIEKFSFIKTVDGNIRAGYQHHDDSVAGDFKDSALGGKLHIETTSWNGISAGASFYTTNVLGDNDNNAVPFFDATGDSYSILGEAYLQAEGGNTLIKVGRQEIDTPFADTDDIGMIPNTFEAALLVNTDIKDTTIVLAHVDSWAGVDVDVEPSKFEALNGDDGVQTVGITYEGIKGLSLCGWYYHADTLVNITYLEAEYEAVHSGVTIGLGGQYAHQDWDAGVAVKVTGASISLGLDNAGLTVGVAYNDVDDDGAMGAFSGFGGGPFFTSSEHLIVDSLGGEGDAFMVSAEWDASAVGIGGLTLGAGHLTLQDNASIESTELDLTVSYAFNDALSIDVIYSDIDDPIDSGNELTNLRVFVNYTF